MPVPVRRVHPVCRKPPRVTADSGSREPTQAVRYRVNESAIVTLRHPVDLVPVIGQVLDVSSNGLRVRVPRTIHRGAQVQIQVEKAAIFGTIRYCRAVDQHSYDVGLAIDQVVLRRDSPLEQDLVGRVSEEPDSLEIYSARTDGAELHPMEILLVEDNPADVKLVELMFEDIPVPHKLTVAVDGAEALKRLRDPAKPTPSLVLLDLNLPLLSGLEVLRTLRAEQAMQRVTVVVLSSSRAMTDVHRATALGIRAYLPKPDNITHYEDLRAKMSALMEEVVA